ncbi:MAG: chorismate mutase [Eubacterium sp.]|nr:chorismate mutase [Eubacterium sp.]
MIDDKNIKACRDKIDELDERLVKIFEERLGIAKEISEYKKARGLQILDSDREEKLITRIKNISCKELAEYNEELFIKIMELSKRHQSR